MAVSPKSLANVALALLLLACSSEGGTGPDESNAGQVGESGGNSAGGLGNAVGGASSPAGGGMLTAGSGGHPSGGAGIGGRGGGIGTGGATGGGDVGTGGRSGSGNGGMQSGGTGNTMAGGVGGALFGGAAGSTTGGVGGAMGGAWGGEGPAGAGGDATGGVGGGITAGAGGDGGANSGGAAGSIDVCPAAQAQACYYVSPSGSDDATGSVDQPFQTLSKARDVVRTVNADMTGNIYVFLRGGEYRITSPVTFGPEDSGTNDQRIVYQAYPGEVPVMNGSTKVEGWTQHDGDIYRASLDRSTKLRNLYVNGARALMTRKDVRSSGGAGTYSVRAGQAPWAWNDGSGSDGINYSTNDVPDIANNKDDLEIVNGTTWNENIVCTRDVVTSGNTRTLLLQQPYGAIAQLPGWNAGFKVDGNHTIFNAYELLSSPGQFYFDKTTGTLYYIPRPGEDMATADVEAPVAEQLIDIAGTSRTNRVKNITLQGITFANTDYNLFEVAGSRGKATCQGSTIWIAYGTGDWHAFKYEIVDTPPAIINVNSAEGIEIVGNVIEHSGNEGIAMHNDVINSNIVGNSITDIAGSGITIGHPQHIYLGDEGSHAKYSADVEGICTNNTINNNFIYNVSMVPGFGGHSGVMAFFVESLSITHNTVHTTGYNGISLGWGWRNFKDSTTCHDNTVSFNRFNNIMARLHDSGAIYTIGQNPGTVINENYVNGIPPNTSGPTYGLHNDEGSAYITENDNVLDIDPGVTYTINCEDFGEKHDLTILRTYATVNKMGVNPPDSQIDTPIVVADAVWPQTQYGYCLNSGVEDAYRSVVPSDVLAVQDYVFPASCEVAGGTATLGIRSSGDASNAVWLAPAGTSEFTEGNNMTKAAGDATSIAVPATPGSYKLFVLDAQGQRLGESEAQLRVN